MALETEKKVVLLAPTPPPEGGIARWTLRMLNSNLDNNWKIELVDEKAIDGREVFGKNSKRNMFIEIKRCFKIWKELNIKVKDKNVYVVHSCIPSATLSMMREYICACIAKHYKKAFIMHFRCTVPNTTKGKIGTFTLKLLCKKCDKIIVLNKQSEEYLKTITKTNMELIPNFIDISEINEKRKINKQINRIVYVGGVIESKGCLDIIEVAKHYPNIQFRLIGKADEKVKKIADDIKNVELTGARTPSDVSKELQLADVFMFLSYFRGEGFSNALAEAMASGLPCIVSNWAANADMIEDKGGVVVPCKSPENVIKALEKIQSSEIRKLQSNFNIDKVKTYYSDSVVIKKYTDLYESFLNN